MVEQIEKLGFEAKLYAFGQRKPFCEVEVGPYKLRAAQRVAAKISELTSLQAVAATAPAGTGIHGGDKRVGIEPLNSAGLSDAWNCIVVIDGGVGNDAGKLRSAALYNAVSVCRIRRAQHREWNPAMPERRAGNLPAVQSITQRMAAYF